MFLLIFCVEILNIELDIYYSCSNSMSLFNFADSSVA